jgi:hypothetical protein
MGQITYYKPMINYIFHKLFPKSDDETKKIPVVVMCIILMLINPTNNLFAQEATERHKFFGLSTGWGIPYGYVFVGVNFEIDPIDFWAINFGMSFDYLEGIFAPSDFVISPVIGTKIYFVKRKNQKLAFRPYLSAYYGTVGTALIVIPGIIPGMKEEIVKGSAFGIGVQLSTSRSSFIDLGFFYKINFSTFRGDLIGSPKAIYRLITTGWGFYF